LEIVGHTDRTGASNYNFLLGEKRANSAKRYLADKFGISLYRMFVVSYGEEKPVAMPDEENASSKNRRVVLQVWGPM
jgi:peptidoglycan-associated lipoprotein